MRGVRHNSSFGRGVPPGRPDASARRPYHNFTKSFVSHPVVRHFGFDAGRPLHYRPAIVGRLWR